MTADPAGVYRAQELVEGLRRTRGLTGKIRFAAKHWSEIQGLGPKERERIALALGSREGSRLLGEFFNRDGEVSETERAVQEGFRSLGDRDPDELKAVAAGLRRGDYEAVRSELVKAAGDSSQPVPPAPPIDLDELREEPSIVAAAAVPVAGLVRRVEAARDVAEEALDEDVAAVPVDVDVDTVENSTVDDSAQDVAPPVPGGRPSAALRARASERRPSRAVLDRSRPPSTGQQLSAGDRLRVLRALHDDTVDCPTVADRWRLVESLGSAWAARRAISQLIRRDLLDSVDEALDLIETIESVAQRTWCLADLVEHMDLDSESADRVLAAAPSGAARRRLARRLERAA